MIACYICGKKTSLKNKILALSNRMIVCKQCFRSHGGFVCRYCNLKYIGQDYNQEQNCCKYCFQGMKLDDEDRKLRFHNYYFKPYPTFFPKLKKHQLYLGVQLQIGGVKDYNVVNQFAAYNENNFFYIKKDSTIPKYGCQIVSYPATIFYHLSVESNWEKILTNAKKAHFRSYNIKDCGLHIHVNKNFFDTNEIAKLDWFVNINKQFFYKISKRHSEFARFLNKPQDLYGVPINKNRHCALNLCPQHTIQFRMFKGTLKYESIMSYLQITNCLCYYIKNNNNPCLQQFLDYSKNQPTIYVNKFLKQIGI